MPGIPRGTRHEKHIFFFKKVYSQPAFFWNSPIPETKHSRFALIMYIANNLTIVLKTSIKSKEAQKMHIFVKRINCLVFLTKIEFYETPMSISLLCNHSISLNLKDCRQINIIKYSYTIWSFFCGKCSTARKFSMSKLSLFGTPAWLYKLLESGNGTERYDEKWHSVKCKYLENKKW